MDQPRKLFLFFALSMGFLYFWSNVVMPNFLPPPPKPGEVADAEGGQENEDGAKVADTDVDANSVDGKEDKSVETPAEDPAVSAPAASTTADAAKEAPPSEVELGSLDPESGYYLQVMLTSKGAAIDSIVLNDPQFLELDRSTQLQILGDTPTDFRTFSTGVDLIDAELKKQGKTLADWNWEQLPDQNLAVDGVNSTVVFKVEIAGIEVRKTYSLKPVKPDERKTALDGYLVNCELSFANKSKEAKSLKYKLQGPVGVRMENEEHSRQNRRIQVAFIGDEDADDDTIAASKLAKLVNDDEVETWKARFRYVGVDNTYFTTLVIADPEEQTIDEIEPMVIDEAPKNKDLSDISLELTSLPMTIPAGKVVAHKFQFFAGPKRRELLDQAPLEASQVLDFGFTGVIARGMLSLLRFFHGLGLPYGLAIICLTVLVRGCMFPLSRKQALNAEKMKSLQPQIQALKDKYGDEKEKIAKAQMELFAKNKYNPFAGCLPLFFQFPIFIGLYTALYHAVDLRLAPFLWIDNLAAPDATFRLPFALPFLGQDFSILPIVTVCLFVAQQKLFMPPPTSDEQAMQYKMMNFMTIAFGFFFWHSPAGLCLYFIASSLWGITERKLLARGTAIREAEAAEGGDDDSDDSGGPKNPRGGNAAKKNEPKPDRELGFFERKLKELQEAAAEANQTGTQRGGTGGSNRKNKKKKKR
ncbi:MAG: membrane protein insertase YidC [Planctomycetaceae bacterium]